MSLYSGSEVQNHRRREVARTSRAEKKVWNFLSDLNIGDEMDYSCFGVLLLKEQFYTLMISFDFLII